MSGSPANQMRVAAIVEGHGEFDAVRPLVERIGYELIGLEFVDVLQPFRERRDRLIHDIDGALKRAIEHSANMLKRADELLAMPSVILVLVDADDDDASTVEARMAKVAAKARSDCRTVCIAATKEYETWFVAAAESLTGYLNLSKGEPPDDPERQRCGKAWIEQRFKKRKYTPPIDQAKLTARMDLTLCRQRSPSFDKLCRELEKALRKK